MWSNWILGKLGWEILLGIPTWREVICCIFPSRNYEISDFLTSLERNISWGLGPSPSTERCVCVVCYSMMVESASEHCISSSGQVLNLCDPARDYGGSGRKMGLETHPSSLITDSVECLCVFMCVWFILTTKEGFFFLQIVLTGKRNYVIYTCLILLNSLKTDDISWLKWTCVVVHEHISWICFCSCIYLLSESRYETGNCLL